MPFTAGEFFAVFVRYNLDVWPIQVILLAAAAATTLLAMRGRPAGARIASWILAALWIWMGAAYHIAYFSRVNPAAYVFGVLFVGQGFIYAWEGGIRNRLGFRVRWDLLGVIGGVLIVHAFADLSSDRAVPRPRLSGFTDFWPAVSHHDLHFRHPPVDRSPRAGTSRHGPSPLGRYRHVGGLQLRHCRGCRASRCRGGHGHPPLQA